MRRLFLGPDPHQAQIWAPVSGTAAPTRKREIPQHAGFGDGETRTRTGDTTIFSRVLYQLSYLASALEG
jgi:hypothetical protein